MYSNSTVHGQDREQEKGKSDFPADRGGTAAAALSAAPPPGDVVGEDLFTREKLAAIAEEKSIPIDADGIKAFWDEMHASGWILYGKPIEKRFIARALRGWLAYHSEFDTEDEEETKEDSPAPDPIAFKTLKELQAMPEKRDSLLNSICLKTNAKNNTDFDVNQPGGFEKLGNYLKRYERVIARTTQFTDEELRAMRLLWDVNV